MSDFPPQFQQPQQCSQVPVGLANELLRFLETQTWKDVNALIQQIAACPVALYPPPPPSPPIEEQLERLEADTTALAEKVSSNGDGPKGQT